MMPSFFHYLLTLLSGHKRWHVLLLIILLCQIAIAAWFLTQQRLQHTQYVEQLFELNAQSALMANHAVAISQLKLNEFGKLTTSVEHYQQKLDELRPAYQQGVSSSWQTFKQLGEIWQPIRGAAADLLAAEEKLRDLRIAVEDTDQRLPAVLAEHDRVIDALRSALKKPASLRLLREQRLVLHRMVANTNAATASVLSAVDTNARIALSGSIETDLFLLGKSLEIMAADNKEALAAAKQEGSDVSLLLKIDEIAERLTELAISIRKVAASLTVMQDINKYTQLLVEDGGLLVRPVQQLITDRLYANSKLSKEQFWLWLSCSLVLLWLLYMAYCQAKQFHSEKLASSSQKESLQTSVDGIVRQLASFSEGDHAITVRSKSLACQHLVEQTNRMIAYVRSLDKQIEKDFLPLIERVATAEMDMAATIDRQANDIARLSVELNNVVSGQTTGSTELASQLVQTQSQLQSLLQQVDQAKQQLSESRESDSTEFSAHAVRQLQQHIEDRLRSLTELSQRINLEIIDVSTSLAGRSGSDRTLRRSVESVQSLTGRYEGQVNDTAQLLNDMTSNVEFLLQQMEQVDGITKILERFQSNIVGDVAEIDQGMSEFASVIAGADRTQARHAEAISLILDELQEGNQRFLVAAVNSDVGIKRLHKLAMAQVNTVKVYDAGNVLDEESKS